MCSTLSLSLMEDLYISYYRQHIVEFNVNIERLSAKEFINVIVLAI